MADPIEITAPITLPPAIQVTAPITLGYKGDKGDRGDDGADALPLVSSAGAYYDLSTMLPGDTTSVTLATDAAYAEGTDLRLAADASNYFDATVTSKNGAYVNLLVTKVVGTADGMEWRVSVIGAKGDKGDKGDRGDDGTDATVTATNIATAANGTDEISSPADSDIATVLVGGALRRVSFAGIWTWIKSKIDGVLTIAGAKSFSGQVELTGQSATNATSAMTLELTDALPVSGLQKVFRVIIANAPVSNSGASATVARSGNLTCYFQSSSAANGYAGIQAGVSLGSAFIDYSSSGWVGVAIPSGALNLPADQVFRVKIENGAKSITDTLTSKGIAFEAATIGGVRQLRVLGFNTVLTTGDWVNASGVEENWLILATDGAGTVKLWRKNYSTNALTLIAQISGGPVGSAASTGHRLSLVLLNNSSTTSTQPVYLNAAREILVFGRLNLSAFP